MPDVVPPLVAPVRITTLELQQEVEAAEKATLLKYYEIDDSNPYAPRFKPRPGVEIVPVTGELAELGIGLDIANALSLHNRRRAYSRLRKLKPQLKPVVSAGDSWFLHPLLRDVINQLIDGHGYAIYSLDAAGAELSEVVKDDRLPKAIVSEKAETVLLSGGGNDLMGGHFGDYLKHYTKDDGKGPARLFNDALTDALRTVCNHYRGIIDSVKTSFPGVKVFTHSYDYVIPRKGKQGKWLGGAMLKNEITDDAEQQGCIRYLLDRFTEELKKVCAEFPGTAYYISRTAHVGAMQWDDEIHPTNEGFAVVASNFKSALKTAGVEP